MKKRLPKPNNGEGESGLISLHFNLNDPTEREAYEMARQLATTHGRRKHVIVAVLYGLSQYQKETGIQLNADTMMGLALKGSLIGGLVQSVSAPIEASRPKTLREPTVVVSSARKASAQEVANNFLNCMGGLFD
jgi:hypothetical protein